jgi:hypothetical protein
MWGFCSLAYYPGEGRGPGGKAEVMTDERLSPNSPTWPPAFAGVVETEGVAPR